MKKDQIVKDLFCCSEANHMAIPILDDWEALEKAGLGLKRKVAFPYDASAEEVESIIIGYIKKKIEL